jgi:hypothetical protein
MADIVAEVCSYSSDSWELQTNFDEFSTCSDAEPVFGGVVRVSVIATPRGILLVVHMTNDRHRNQNDGCADDYRRSYQSFPFHFAPHPADDNRLEAVSIGGARFMKRSSA